MRVISIRAKESEIQAWKKALAQASERAGTKLTLSQWIRGRLNEAAKKSGKK